MDIVTRAVGALLLLTAAIVGIYFVVDQLEVLPFIWAELNYLMALSIVLGVIFAYMRKRSLEASGLDRISHAPLLSKPISCCSTASCSLPCSSSGTGSTSS